MLDTLQSLMELNLISICCPVVLSTTIVLQLLVSSIQLYLLIQFPSQFTLPIVSGSQSKANNNNLQFSSSQFESLLLPYHLHLSHECNPRHTVSNFKMKSKNTHSSEIPWHSEGFLLISRPIRRAFLDFSLDVFWQVFKSVFLSKICLIIFIQFMIGCSWCFRLRFLIILLVLPVKVIDLHVIKKLKRFTNVGLIVDGCKHFNCFNRFYLSKERFVRISVRPLIFQQSLYLLSQLQGL